MTDEWAFRTTTGRATVRNGRLRVSTSLSRLAREKVREGWIRNDSVRRVLFLVSVGSALGLLGRGVSSARAVFSGSAGSDAWFVLALVCFVAVALAYRLVRTRTLRLREVTAVRRVEDDRLRVEYAEGRKHLDVETPTEKDADEAVEMFQLRGVPVEEGRDAEVPSSRGFRERLRAKVE